MSHDMRRFRSCKGHHAMILKSFLYHPPSTIHKMNEFPLCPSQFPLKSNCQKLINSLTWCQNFLRGEKTFLTKGFFTQNDFSIYRGRWDNFVTKIYLLLFRNITNDPVPVQWISPQMQQKIDFGFSFSPKLLTMLQRGWVGV